MRSTYTRSFVTVWTLGLIILIGAGLSAFGQGKGHGGGKSDKGDRSRSEERGGGRVHADNPGQQKRQDRQEPRQARGNQGNEGRNKHDNRPDTVIIQQQPQYRVERGQGNGKWKQRDERRQPNVYPVYPPQQIPPAWSNVGPDNYGQQRSSEVHARNAERKALKDQARMSGNYYGRDYRQNGSNYYSPNTNMQRYSYDPRNTYQQRDSLRGNILRSVIGMVLENNMGSQYNAPQYNDYNSYGIPYNPAYNGGGYYSPNAQYQDYGRATPYYNNSQTNAYPYSSTYGGGSPLYSNGGASQIVVPLLANLLGSRGGFVGRLVSQLLASGYNQGYQDAQYARLNGYGNQYYQDPYAHQAAYTQPAYAYNDIGYDPYSSLAENRQYLSEGYELGYHDALNTRNQSGIFGNSSGGDLISALLGSILQSN